MKIVLGILIGMLLIIVVALTNEEIREEVTGNEPAIELTL